ncbi:hypothetical protein C0991_009843 [Blastosporella zonata]|nr:hypothetical protein C0991_009843 [Blastosporella zonata]
MSPRRSTRLNTTSGKPPSTVDTVVEDTHVSDYQEVNEQVEPKKKGQNKSTKSKLPASLQFKNVRGRRGALKDIVEMPVDIFMHLNPAEVLHLSRTCKSLRHMLMAKSAEFIWRQARLNLEGFPDCPEDLNEPQYACLMFDATCNEVALLDMGQPSTLLHKMRQGKNGLER